MLPTLACVTLLIGATPTLEQTYSIDAFTQDCHQSGGTPKLFDHNVTCEDKLHGTITCLRSGDAVQSCTLSAPQKT